MISEKDIEFYRQNGYLLVKNVFAESEVMAMRQGIERIFERAARANYTRNAAWDGDYLTPELKNLVIKGLLDVHYHDASFTRAAIHPNMSAVLSKIIGPNVQLHHSKLVVKPPEEGAVFPMHQDYPYFPHERHTMLAASVHLDNADLENGCLHVIPGSHKDGLLEHIGRFYLNQKEYAIDMGIPLAAGSGDVIFFNYMTIHGSKANLSPRPRRNVLFQYRDPEDLPTKQVHINWGQGLMVCGENNIFREYSDTSSFSHRKS